jgi:hypothetical protein
MAGRGLPRQRADHVVGLDAADSQQRQPHRFDGIEQRLQLGAQIVGHGRRCALY